MLLLLRPVQGVQLLPSLLRPLCRHSDPLLHPTGICTLMRDTFCRQHGKPRHPMYLLPAKPCLCVMLTYHLLPGASIEIPRSCLCIALTKAFIQCMKAAFAGVIFTRFRFAPLEDHEVSFYSAPLHSPYFRCASALLLQQCRKHTPLHQGQCSPLHLLICTLHKRVKQSR